MSNTSDNLWKNLLTIIGLIGSIASIVGIVIALLSDKNKAIIALVCVVVALLVVVACIVNRLNQYIKQEHSYLDQFIEQEHSEDFLKLSFFTTFKQIDDTHSEYDGYRLIQSKRPILKEVPWGFKWTGSKLPKISSTLQDCNGQINPSTNDYDNVVLKFRKPLNYNETAVLHFHAEMDDIDGTAQPHLDVKIESPLSIVHYRVVLCNKEQGTRSKAKFMRMPIHCSTPSSYKTLDTISFDPITHSYEYVLTDPEVGYYYRLEWEKV